LIASKIKCNHCPDGHCTGITDNGFTAPKHVIGPNNITLFVAAKYKCSCNKTVFQANDERFHNILRLFPELAFVEKCPRRPRHLCGQP
jgi:hypothetical protein